MSSPEEMLKLGEQTALSSGDNKRDSNEVLALYEAAQNGDEARVRLLVLSGCNPNATLKDGASTPLFVATFMGHANVVRTLLTLGAKSTALLNEGRTLLHLAAQEGHTDIMHTLVASGISPDAIDDLGRTPLWHAAAQGQAETIHTLVALGASPSFSDNKNTPPLCMTAQGNHIDAMSALILSGASVGDRAADGVSSLHKAAYMGHTDAIHFLIISGADRDMLMPNGRTPLYCAVEQGHAGAVCALIERGANPYIPENSGVTPLWVAAALGYLEIAHVLVHAGANPWSSVLIQEQSLNCLEIAVRKGQAEVVTFLRGLPAPELMLTSPDFASPIRDFSHTPMTDEDMRTLALWSAQDTQVEKLFLRSVGMTPQGAQKFAQALEANTTLEFLDISDNPLGPEGLQHFQQALAGNKTLQVLVRDNAQAAEPASAAIDTALYQNEQLKKNQLIGLTRMGIFSLKTHLKNSEKTVLHSTQEARKKTLVLEAQWLATETARVEAQAASEVQCLKVLLGSIPLEQSIVNGFVSIVFEFTQHYPTLAEKLSPSLRMLKTLSEQLQVLQQNSTSLYKFYHMLGESLHTLGSLRTVAFHKLLVEKISDMENRLCQLQDIAKGYLSLTDDILSLRPSFKGMF
jgi:ankyrin repeat protein